MKKLLLLIGITVLSFFGMTAKGEPLFGVLKPELESHNNVLTVKVLKDPVIGIYYTKDFLDLAMDGQETLRNLKWLKSLGFNMLVVNVRYFAKWGDCGKLFIEAAHKDGFLVIAGWGAGNFPEWKNFSAKNDDIFIIDQNGKAGTVPCFNNPKVQEFINIQNLCFFKEFKVDGVVIDEPTYPEWGKTERRENIYCYCSHSGEIFQKQHGFEIPVIDNLKTISRNDPKWKLMINFRKSTLTSYIQMVLQGARKGNRDLVTQVVLTPEYGLDAYSADLSSILDLKCLDSIQLDPYWVSYGRSPEWVNSFVTPFTTEAHKQGKSCSFWLQGYLEGGQIKTGIAPGAATKVIDFCLGGGCDGIILFCWKGFASNSMQYKDYTWEKYAEEFSLASAKYQNQLSPEARIHIWIDSRKYDFIGDAKITLPPEAVIKIQIEQPGYRSWQKEFSAEKSKQEEIFEEKYYETFTK
jgi:hypothetical protein